MRIFAGVKRQCGCRRA